MKRYLTDFCRVQEISNYTKSTISFIQSISIHISCDCEFIYTNRFFSQFACDAACEICADLRQQEHSNQPCRSKVRSGQRHLRPATTNAEEHLLCVRHTKPPPPWSPSGPSGAWEWLKVKGSFHRPNADWTQQQVPHNTLDSLTRSMNYSYFQQEIAGIFSHSQTQDHVIVLQVTVSHFERIFVATLLGFQCLFKLFHCS